MAGCILVVDDDAAICSLLVEFLTDEGYDVITATNGREGVESAKRFQPDCILMDLHMPVLDGVTAINQLKHDPQTCHIPICAMSAARIIRKHKEHLPADGILTKPFDLYSVIQEIDEHAREVVRDWDGDRRRSP